MNDDEQAWLDFTQGADSRRVPGFEVTYDEVARWQAAKDSGLSWNEMERRFGRRYGEMVRPMLAVREERGR